MGARPLSVGREVVLFFAATAAGTMNAFAGGGSIVAFPALVWSGLPPTVANATNTVAIFPGSLAAMIPFRSDLAATRPWLVRLLPWSVLGGVLGAVLMLATPERTFARLVPGLILLATALFAAQEIAAGASLRAVAGESPPATGAPAGALESEVDVGPSAGATAAVLQLAISVYGGYFGAGIGILMLASLGRLGLRDLHRRMAVRTALATCINGVAALCFVARGAVDWRSALVMTAGQVLGGYGGAAVARSVPPHLARLAVVLIGTGMALAMALRGG